MKVQVTVSGGRFGYGFDYWCPECDLYLGNSSEDKVLTHPSEFTDGFFLRKKTVKSTCPHAGKKYAMPDHSIEVVETI